jgi:hypothetical protein
VLKSSSRDCPGACYWNTPTYSGDITRTLVDLLVAEEEIAKSVDSDLRTFGDSGIVCLGARLAETPKIRKAAITSMLVFVV